MQILPLIDYYCRDSNIASNKYFAVSDSDATLRKTFSQLDKNGDGNLDANEFSTMVVDNFPFEMLNLTV